jgi:hypothetical protein
MEYMDHEDAVNLQKEDLEKNCVAIIGEFEEQGSLGFSTVFCYVSVPDRAVEHVSRKTGWKKIGSNEFFVPCFIAEVKRILEKISLED